MQTSYGTGIISAAYWTLRSSPVSFIEAFPYHAPAQDLPPANCPPLADRAANGRPYGESGRETRGVEDAAPYDGKVPVLSLRASAHTGVAIRNPVPFFSRFQMAI